MTRRGVFLDRDGVLIRSLIHNGRPYAICPGESVDILPGVVEACSALKKAGFLLAMVTNQPDVARGKTPRRFVDETNHQIAVTLGIDTVRVCFHDSNDGCDCRKPKPGMIVDAARDLAIDLPASFMVGDRWRDIQAGRSAGCLTILIDYDYKEFNHELPDHTAQSLMASVNWITNKVVTRGVE